LASVSAPVGAGPSTPRGISQDFLKPGLFSSNSDSNAFFGGFEFVGETDVLSRPVLHQSIKAFDEFWYLVKSQVETEDLCEIRYVHLCLSASGVLRCEDDQRTFLVTMLASWVKPPFLKSSSLQRHGWLS